MQRRSLLQKLSAVGAMVAAPSTAAAKQEEYPAHRTSKELGIIGNQITFHHSQDRAAFISAAFEDGIELYVAEDVSDETDIPRIVYQITSETVGGVFDPEWERGNTLSFQKNLSRYSVKVTRSYKVLEHKMTKENVIDVEKTLKNARVVNE